jgi:hypothetical protein
MKRAEIDRKFDEIVDFSGVEKCIATPVKHYSSRGRWQWIRCTNWKFSKILIPTKLSWI